MRAEATGGMLIIVYSRELPSGLDVDPKRDRGVMLGKGDDLFWIECSEFL